MKTILRGKGGVITHKYYDTINGVHRYLTPRDHDTTKNKTITKQMLNSYAGGDGVDEYRDNTLLYTP